MHETVSGGDVGTVYLVGAGPGDPDLITVRGLRAIQQADVILHDRLIAAELLAQARPTAEIRNVGKHPGVAGVSQTEINHLLVEYAQTGKCVCRLKGGDPFVFGRGGEEALACVRAGVPCIVVPGVSSAHAVPAAAGIPLTHRGMARSYAVVTAQTDPKCPGPNLPYEALVAIDTVVILMGRSALAGVAAGLMAAGRSPLAPAACIEMGCTAQQRSISGTLETLSDLVEQAGLSAPVVTVVGDVAALVQEIPHSYPMLAEIRAAVALPDWDLPPADPSY